MCTLSKEYLRSQYKVAVADFKMAQDDMGWRFTTGY